MNMPGVTASKRTGIILFVSGVSVPSGFLLAIALFSSSADCNTATQSGAISSLLNILLRIAMFISLFLLYAGILILQRSRNGWARYVVAALKVLGLTVIWFAIAALVGFSKCGIQLHS